VRETMHETLSYIARELAKRGYKITEEASIRGIAGFSYKFDLIVEDPSTKKKVSLMYVEEVDARHVIPILAIRYGMDMKHVIICTSSDEHAARLLREAGITVLSFESISDSSKLLEFIEKIFKENKG